MTIPTKFYPRRVQDAGRIYADMAGTRRILEESDRDTVRFIEGPPTLNGSPHAGHLRGRIIKDLWYRYTTLTGKKVLFYGGWDTQGLPVELQAEKELGVSGDKSAIEKSVGIERLVEQCKAIVSRYNAEWEEADYMMGMSMNHEGSYWTYTDEYIQREWQILKKAQESGILEDDYTVIGYCPGCQTSLSHAEVNQGYEMVTDPSLYYKVRLVDEDIYLVVWTTMPFTLVTDAMVGLHPAERYCVVHIHKYDEKWVIAQQRLDAFMTEMDITTYDIVSVVEGSAFEGKRYVHPLLDKIPELEKLASRGTYHVAVAESFVDVNSGTGLVHLAPANGEEDMQIAHRRSIEIFCPIDEQVRFTDQAGAYSSLFVRDADNIIVSDLGDAKALVRIGTIKHKYPLCWRSKHPIVWLARRGWFYKLDRLDSKTLHAAQAVKYFFDAPKNRFLGIVGEEHPWCISRERYWGCPMPVWHCNDCSAKTWYYTKGDIIDNAESLPDGRAFELHRPWIDRIHVRCHKCSSYNTYREQYVLDTWHNSGAAPFASLDDDTYKNEIPAPFFTEGIDQTRGWAYTLLVENVILGDVSPYQSFLFQGHVLDERGGKMSKSLGNVILARDLLKEHPVDLVRLYFMWKASPVEPLNFSPSEMTARPYQILSTLYNLHLYYMQNSEYDNYDPAHDVQWAKDGSLLEHPDTWILSKLQHTIRVVTEKIEQCRFHEAAKSIEEFMINSLSQSYIPSVRGQLWEDDASRSSRRAAIYAVMSRCLKTLDIMIHPFCPFTSEYVYREAFGGSDSILLQSWPTQDTEMINEDIENAFDSMRSILTAAAAARARAKLKRRWPLHEALIVAPTDRKSVDTLQSYLRERMNVERLHTIQHKDMADGLEAYLQMRKIGMPVIPIVSLDRKRLGPRLKDEMPQLSLEFGKISPHTIIESLEKGHHVFSVNGNDIVLAASDFIIGYEPAAGYQCATKDGHTVFISTKSDDATIARWLLRDVARQIQNLRKELGYNPTDILDEASVIGLNDTSVGLVESGQFGLSDMVRVKRVTFEPSIRLEYKDIDIDGQKMRIGIGHH
ncbi:MAG: isoleucine--tRNA ligase [Cenarchaeum sp. SB0662_bin_33]|nr:isoleucine--tRNA ligase [Cenarchaeum sp. SB0664_bin_35]MYB47092.1 isoleucine--tRNA ligase [Cenarchaeum sp. SB0662_bin_33]